MILTEDRTDASAATDQLVGRICGTLEGADRHSAVQALIFTACTVAEGAGLDPDQVLALVTSHASASCQVKRLRAAGKLPAAT